MIARQDDSQQRTNNSHHRLAKPSIGETFFELIADLAERDIRWLLLGDDQDVQSRRQLSAVATKKFAHDRVAHFAADCDAQPGLPHVIRFADNDEIGGVDLFSGS